MISHGKDIKIFTGNANPKLAADICKIIGTKLGESEVKSFADGEASVSLYETVRGSDVFLVQSTCKPVNDSLMELLIMVDACRRASAGRITAVIPYFGYARQDRKAKSRTAGRLRAALINTVETFKNPFLMLFRNPDSMIKHVNAEQVAAAPFHRNFDFGIFIAVFDRVVDQVDDRLLQKLGVGMNHHIIRNLKIQSDVFRLGARTAELHSLAHRTLHRNFRHFIRGTQALVLQI